MTADMAGDDGKRYEATGSISSLSSSSDGIAGGETPLDAYGTGIRGDTTVAEYRQRDATMFAQGLVDAVEELELENKSD